MRGAELRHRVDGKLRVKQWRRTGDGIEMGDQHRAESGSILEGDHRRVSENHGDWKMQIRHGRRLGAATCGQGEQGGPLHDCPHGRASCRTELFPARMPLGHELLKIRAVRVAVAMKVPVIRRDVLLEVHAGRIGATM